MTHRHQADLVSRNACHRAKNVHQFDLTDLTCVFSSPAFSKRFPIVPVLSSEAKMPFPGAVKREATSRSPELFSSSIPLMKPSGYVSVLHAGPLLEEKRRTSK